MHVIFDMTFPARNRSGIGVYGRQLLAALRRVAATAPERWRIETFCAPGFQSKPDPLRKIADGAGFLLGVEAALPLHVWRRRPNLLHAPAFIAPLWLGGCPLALTCHDTILEDGWQAFHPAWRLFHRLSLRRGLACAAAVITPSQQSAGDLQRVYRLDAARLHVIPSAADPVFRLQAPPAVAAALQRLGVAAPYILNVSAQVERKNLARLVQAFGQLSARFSDLTLVLVGPPGNATTHIEQTIAQLGLAARVRRLTAVSVADLAALYSGAALFAFPSLYEGFGLPILEAQACGAVVVTSRRGALAEIAGEAAILIDPTQVASLVQGLEQGLTDEPLRQRLHTEGLAHAAGFSWERSAAATLRVYRQIGA